MNELRSVVRDLLTRDDWSKLWTEVGAGELLIPSEYGGADATMVEAVVVLEELGRVLSPAPYLSSVLAAQALVHGGDDAACRRLLPRLAAGHVLALAWTDVHGRWTSPACTYVNGHISGTAHYVLDADRADAFLVPAGSGLYEVDRAHAHIRVVPALDLSRCLATVSFEAAPAVAVGGFDPAVIRDIACVAVSAEQVGAASRALELTVEYAKMRFQFGRAIGAFQALQHRLADLHVLVESARALSYAAARGEAHPSAAKVYCTEALRRTAAEMIQIHGGIGITWEHDAHRYFKRAHATAHLFGPVSDHLAAALARV